MTLKLQRGLKGLVVNMLGKVISSNEQDLVLYIPTDFLSNNDSRGFTITCNGVDNPYNAFELFNRIQTKNPPWLYIGQYIMIELPEPKVFTYILLQAFYNVTFSVSGSNDGRKFEKLAEYKCGYNGIYRPIKFTNYKMFKFYKITIENIEEWNGNYGRKTGVHQIHLF